MTTEFEQGYRAALSGAPSYPKKSTDIRVNRRYAEGFRRGVGYCQSCGTRRTPTSAVNFLNYSCARIVYVKCVACRVEGQPTNDDDGFVEDEAA